MTAALATREIREADELDGLAAEWWALWRRAPQATPFQAPAWLIPWWTSFRPGELRTIVVEDGGRLIGLAPLYLESGPFGRRLLPVGISVSDYLDVLLDPDCAHEAGTAIMAHLAQAEWAWETMELQELAPGAAALGLPVPPGLEESATEQSTCPVLPLDLGGGAPVRALPPNKRNNLNNARNRAAAEGATWRRLCTGDLEPFFQALVALHEARWRERGSGVLQGETVRSFHRMALAGLLESGLARLYLVEAGGRPAGAYYGFLHGGIAMAYLTGFDPHWERISPGTLLFGHAIEEAAREGGREFHFLRGQEAYKYSWGAVDRWNRRRLFRRMAPR